MMLLEGFGSFWVCDSQRLLERLTEITVQLKYFFWGEGLGGGGGGRGGRQLQAVGAASGLGDLLCVLGLCLRFVW